MRVTAVALGLCVTVLLLCVQWWGWIPGPALLSACGLTALAVPTSREFSRRALYAGCAFLGLVPLLWRFSVAPLPTLGFVFALGVGVLAGFTYSQPNRRAALRRLLPRVRPVDGAVAAGLLLSLWLMWPLLRVGSAIEALSMLHLGWDYAAHFNMAEMLRVHGTPISGVPQGAMGPWQYADYPAGFHAVVASVMELTAGTAPVSQGVELTEFARATALVCLAAVGTVLAGLVALPAARRHPVVASVVTLLACMSITVGPGAGNLLVHGFPNFLVAAALLACIPLLVIPLVRLTAPAPIIALGAVLVGLAHNWAPLLVPALVGCLAAFLPLRSSRWPASFAGWLQLVGVATLTGLGLTTAWHDLSSGEGGVDLGGLLITEGGFVAGTKAEILASVIGAVAACSIALVVRRRSGRRSGDLLRLGGLATMPIVGSALGLGIAVYQLERAGHLSYYFWKYMTAVQVVSVVLLAAAIITLVGARHGRAAGWRWTAAVAAAVCGVFAILIGVLHVATNLVVMRVPPGFVSRALLDSASKNHDLSTSVILDASGTVTGDVPHFLVPSRLEGTAPRLMNQWVFALTGQWSESSYEVIDALWGDDTPAESRPHDASTAVSKILDLSPSGLVVVEPGDWANISETQEGTGRADRVVTWR